jgi:dolichyl-diphosphooligosaccharide--protein glycosyltransferase
MSDDEVSLDLGWVKKAFKKQPAEAAPAHAPAEHQPPQHAQAHATHPAIHHATAHPAPKEEGEIALKFDFFKNIFNKPKAHAPQAGPPAPADEGGIDVAKVAGFLRKHHIMVVLAALLILQFVPNGGTMPWGGIWMRLQVSDLPVADEWAHNTVQNYYANQVRDQINRQYPSLPEAGKAKLVSEQMEQFRKANAAVIDEQTRQVAQQFRSQFQYEHGGESYLYMPDIDPYVFMRHAQNVLERGEHCDERRDGVCYDTLQFAPLGHPQSEKVFLPYALAWLHRIATVFKPGIPLMQSLGYFPVVFVLLSLIPAFFIGRKLGGNVAGFFGGTLIAIHQAFLSRTEWGHPDSDALNIFLPLMIAWLFMEALESRSLRNRALLTAGAGFFTGFFALVWPSGWWYIFDFLIATAVLNAAFLAWQHRKDLGRFLQLPDIRATLVILGIFIVSSGIFVSLFLDPVSFVRAPLGPLRIILLKVAAHATLWPNVYTTVAELNPISIQGVINTFGRLMFSIAMLGLAFTIIGRRGQHGHADAKYAILLGLWTASTLYASTKGVRFTMLLVPAFALGIGAAFGLAYQWVTRWAAKDLKLRKAVTGTALVLLFGLIIILAKVPAVAYGTAKSDIPLVNDAWWNTLTAIKEQSEPDAIITSWWDFGHHFKYIADRPVTFDGGSQNTPMAHWVGRLLLTDNERLSIGILRMLDCGSNRAFEKAFNVTEDPVRTVDLLYRILPEGRDSAGETLVKAGFTEAQAAEVLRYSHCEPPEGFVIASEDMIGKAGVWGHFGSWNFIRAALWVQLRHQPRDQAVAEMTRRFNMTEERAEELYFEAQALPDEGAANQWIAPWPGYLSGLAGCRATDRLISCDQGVTVNLTNDDARVQGQKAALFVFISKDGEYIQRPSKDGDPKIGIVLIPTRDGYQSLVATPDLASSIFTRMFFMEGHGLQYYRPFRSDRQVTGGMIHTYTADWDGGEKNVMEALKPRETAAAGYTVTFNYIGWLDNGTVFDSSMTGWKERGVTKDSAFEEPLRPLVMKLGEGRLIPGFEQGIIGMKRGEVKAITVPPELGYGLDPAAHQLGNQTLHFRVRLEDIR